MGESHLQEGAQAAIAAPVHDAQQIDARGEAIGPSYEMTQSDFFPLWACWASRMLEILHKGIGSRLLSPQGFLVGYPFP